MSFYSEAKVWADDINIKIYPLVAPAESSTFFCVYANTDTQYTYSNFGIKSVSKQYTFTIAGIRYSDTKRISDAFYDEFKNHLSLRFDGYSERYEDGYYIMEYIFNFKEE